MESMRVQREKSEGEPVRVTRKPDDVSSHRTLVLNDAHSLALRLGPIPNSQPPSLQTKLAINEPGDQYEQEADRVAEQVMRMPDPAIHLQRKCGCSGSSSSGESCEECSQQSLLQRTAIQTQSTPDIITPQSVPGALRSAGWPLDAATRAFMESRFNHDFGHVRIHTGQPATESAGELQARAYTLGRDIVFGSGQYAPETSEGKKLLAHELTHVIQQSSNSGAYGSNSSPGFSRLQRACLPAAVCSAPIAGSPGTFNVGEEALEEPHRRRREALPPGRAGLHGHGGRASQLEIFLRNNWPTGRARLRNIFGIFIDQDMSPTTGAITAPCLWLRPPIAGAPPDAWCTFVPGALNQEAATFNHGTGPIRGIPREAWRVETLRTLIHETQHAIFGTRRHPRIAGGPCSRRRVQSALTELNAVMSEFIVTFREPPVSGNSAHPALRDWFDNAIDGSGESIRGAVTDLRCHCDCADANNWIIHTFDFVVNTATTRWNAVERDLFNDELRGRAGLDWPL
jgi:hypothetical protein